MLRSIINSLSATSLVLALLAPACADAAQSAHPAFQVKVSGNPKGAPIILIPGLASAGAVWDGTVAHYCGAHQCHVLTLAGFAGVAPVEGPLLSAVERELFEYIVAEKLAHPTVIGHSLGGFLALKLAIDHPDQVGRLVIVDSLPALGAAQASAISAEQLKSDAEGMRRGMLAQDAASASASQAMAIRTMVTRPDDVDRVLAWGARSDRITVINAMADLMGEDLRQDIARIKAPTLVLGSWIAYSGYVDKPVFERNYRNQYARLPGVQVELLDTARHFIMLDDPAGMHDRIDHFLD